MPVYLCSTPADSLDARKRQRIADEITRIHCELTGAPPTFAHVLFVDSAGPECWSVLGTIRAGRSEETKSEMRRRMGEAVARAGGVEAAQVEVHTADVPASWVMEAGELLPEPGEEAEWLARHA